MSIKEDNRTKHWIIIALLDLLASKKYHDITISQIVNKAGLGRRTFYRYFQTKDQVMERVAELLMDEFADEIAAYSAETQERVAEAYFAFWEAHVDILLLLSKAHLLYFIEDNLIPLLHRVAIKMGHIKEPLHGGEMPVEYEEYKYDFAIKLAGFWKATMIWVLENPRKSPKEMSRIINRVLR